MRPRRSTAPRDGRFSVRVTWPLIWPVTVLCLTIQLILQLKIFDQVYLFARRRAHRSDDGAGAIHLRAGFPAQFGRLRRDDCGRAVRHRRRLFRAAISAVAHAGRAMTAPASRRKSAAARIVDLGGALLTTLTVICACVWFFPIYWALVTSFRTDDEAIKSFSLLPRAPHPRQLSLYYRALETADFLPQFDNRLACRHRNHPGDVDLRRLRDFAVAISRPSIAVVDDPGEFHDPGAGADRQPFRHHRLGEFDQHLRRHHPAAADRAGDGDRLQAILRFCCRASSARPRSWTAPTSFSCCSGCSCR